MEDLSQVDPAALNMSSCFTSASIVSTVEATSTSFDVRWQPDGSNVIGILVKIHSFQLNFFIFIFSLFYLNDSLNTRPTTFYMFLSNLLVSWLYMLLTIISSGAEGIFRHTDYLQILSQFYWLTTDVMNMVSVHTLAAISFELLWGTVNHHLRKKCLTWKTALEIMVLLWLLGAVLNMSPFFGLRFGLFDESNLVGGYILHCLGNRYYVNFLSHLSSTSFSIISIILALTFLFTRGIQRQRPNPQCLECRTRYKIGGPLERCSTIQQYSLKINCYSKKASQIGTVVSVSLDTGTEHPSRTDICVNADIFVALLRLRGISSGQNNILPQGNTILDLSKSRGVITCNNTDTLSSAKDSSALANADNNPAHNTSQPFYTKKHREKIVRMRSFRRARKIVVLGDMMSGKSNLISAYCSDKYNDNYIPTIFRCLQTDANILGEKIDLVVVDISGRDDFQPLRRCAYRKMDAAIICYPVDSSTSFERVRSYWVPELRKYAPKAPFVVVGTKRDIRDEARDRVEEHKQKLRRKGREAKMAGRLSAEAAFMKTFVSHNRGKRVSNDLGAAAFYECCSIYRDGTRKVFEGVAKVALQKSRRKRKMRNRHVDNVCTIL